MPVSTDRIALTLDDVTVRWNDNPTWYDENGELIDTTDTTELVVTYRDDTLKLSFDRTVVLNISDDEFTKTAFTSMAVTALSHDINRHTCSTRGHRPRYMVAQKYHYCTHCMAELNEHGNEIPMFSTPTEP